MRDIQAFTAPRGEPAFSLDGATASAAASHRASLVRGLAFVLLLAASSLASAYLPTVLAGPDWVEGRASTSRPAAP